MSFLPCERKELTARIVDRFVVRLSYPQRTCKSVKKKRARPVRVSITTRTSRSSLNNFTNIRRSDVFICKSGAQRSLFHPDVREKVTRSEHINTHTGCSRAPNNSASRDTRHCAHISTYTYPIVHREIRVSSVRCKKQGRNCK